MKRTEQKNTPLNRCRPTVSGSRILTFLVFVSASFSALALTGSADSTAVTDSLTYGNAFDIFFRNKQWITSESAATTIRIVIGALWLAMTGLMFVRIKRGVVFHLNNIVLMLLGAFEIFYFMSFGEEAVVFLTKAYQPAAPTVLETGLALLMFFIGYLLLLAMIAVQYVALKRTLVDIDIEYDASYANFKVGVYSIPAALTAVYVCNRYYPDTVKWILLGFLACQLIQIGIILFGLRHKPMAAITGVLVYTIGFGGIVFMLSSYFWIIITIVVLCVIGFFMGFSPLGEMSNEAFQRMLERGKANHERELREWWQRKRNMGL